MKLGLVAFLSAMLCALVVIASYVSRRLLISEGFMLFTMFVGDLASRLALLAFLLSAFATVRGLRMKSKSEVTYGAFGILFSLLALLPKILAILIAIAMGTGGAIPR